MHTERVASIVHINLTSVKLWSQLKGLSSSTSFFVVQPTGQGQIVNILSL